MFYLHFNEKKSRRVLRVRSFVFLKQELLALPFSLMMCGGFSRVWSPTVVLTHLVCSHWCRKKAAVVLIGPLDTSSMSSKCSRWGMSLNLCLVLSLWLCRGRRQEVILTRLRICHSTNSQTLIGRFPTPTLWGVHRASDSHLMRMSWILGTKNGHFWSRWNQWLAWHRWSTQRWCELLSECPPIFQFNILNAHSC